MLLSLTLGCSLLPSQAPAHWPPHSSSVHLDVNQREGTYATHGSAEAYMCVPVGATVWRAGGWSAEGLVLSPTLSVSAPRPP